MGTDQANEITYRTMELMERVGKIEDAEDDVVYDLLYSAVKPLVDHIDQLIWKSVADDIIRRRSS